MASGRSFSDKNVKCSACPMYFITRLKINQRLSIPIYLIFLIWTVANYVDHKVSCYLRYSISNPGSEQLKINSKLSLIIHVIQIMRKWPSFGLLRIHKSYSFLPKCKQTTWVQVFEDASFCNHVMSLIWIYFVNYNTLTHNLHVINWVIHGINQQN